MTHPKYAHKGSVETRTIEELAELTLAITKAQRFGWKKYHPSTRVQNTTQALHEIADVRKMLYELEKLILSK